MFYPFFLESISDLPGTRKQGQEEESLVSVEKNFQASPGVNLVPVKSFEKMSNFKWDNVMRVERKLK